MASEKAEVDPAIYFVHYQLPTTLPIIIAVGIAIYLCNKFFDKKDNFVFNAQEIEKELNENEGKEKELKKPPRIYAILPIIPLVLILGFSSVLDSILVLMGISSAEEVKAAASTAIK